MKWRNHWKKENILLDESSTESEDEESDYTQDSEDLNYLYIPEEIDLKKLKNKKKTYTI